MKHEKHIISYETGEFQTVNDNFVQLYIDKLDLIIKMTGENPMAVKVFTWLLKHMDRRNALVISQASLADALSVTRMTIYNSVKYLKDVKALEVYKSGNTNIYAINAQIAWKSTADNKQFALFDARVYISNFEQEDENKAYETTLIGHTQEKKKKRKI